MIRLSSSVNRGKDGLKDFRVFSAEGGILMTSRRGGVVADREPLDLSTSVGKSVMRKSSCILLATLGFVGDGGLSN